MGRYDPDVASGGRDEREPTTRRGDRRGGRTPSSGGQDGPGRRRTGGRPDSDDDAAVAALRDRLAGVLRRLPDIERRVLELRMGLVDGTPAKPGETATRLGLTIHEVRTIEARAFERIREVGPIKGLERFLGR